MNVGKETFEDYTSEEITYTIDRLYEKYDHEKVPVPTPTYTYTPSVTMTPTYTPTYTYTPTVTMTQTYTPSDTITPTGTRTLTHIMVGFNEYTEGTVKMSVLIPDDKTLSGFAFDHSDGDAYNISMAVKSVTPDKFMYEPSTINSSIKRCAFIASSGVAGRVDIEFDYVASPKDGTQDTTGAKIQGLRVVEFIAYDELRQEIQSEIRDELVSK